MRGETILYLVSTLQKGGPVQQLFNLIKYLDRGRFLPHILTLSEEPKDSLLDDFLRINVPVSSLMLGRFSALFKAKKLIADYISKISPAIVHSCGFRADLFSAGIDNVNTVSTLRDNPSEDYFSEFGLPGKFIIAPLHLNALRKIKKTVSVSRNLSEELSKKYGIAFDFIQNGIDTEVFYPSSDEQKRKIRIKLGLPLNHKIFICVGNLSKAKDPLCVAEGFLKAAIDNSTMIFAGEGYLRKKIQSLNNSGKIILAGLVKDIRSWLWASDIFISGSHSEGMPNTVLEAMACSLPCILSDIPAHREILEFNPFAGKLFSKGNCEHLSKAIRNLIDTQFEFSKAAALWITENHLNAKRMSMQYQDLYKSVLQQ